jgi:uncharacterized membrane protein YedE/YeeE
MTASHILLIVRQPWPWYIAGPAIGLFVPVLLLVGNKLFGVSSNLRHLCAATIPTKNEFFRYDWRSAGGWNLAFAAGILVGGAIAGHLLAAPGPIHLSPAAHQSIAALGIHDFSGLVPRELFNWHALLSWRGVVMMIGGGFLIGFGTAYAGGCTSGHAISGLADFQLSSLVAVVGFFAGGLIVTWLVLPRMFNA